MPELPEVETIRRDLAQEILKAHIISVEVLDVRVVRQPVQTFRQRIIGRRFEDVLRRGKALIFPLDSDEFLVIQPMMTGQMVFGFSPPRKDTRVIFRLSGNRALFYNDQRTFGRVLVVKGLAEIGYFNILGPEPLEADFNVTYMRGMFKGRKRPVKNTLMDHTFVAGIGNIYACEILYRSRVSPKRAARRLTGGQIAAVHKNTVEVLKEAIAHRGSSMRNYRDGHGQEGGFKNRIQVYAREGQPCPSCGAPIKRIVQAGRSTFYCSHCQK